MVRKKDQDVEDGENDSGTGYVFSLERVGEEIFLSDLGCRSGTCYFPPRREALRSIQSICMQKMMEKYETCSQESGISESNKKQDPQSLKPEIENMEERIRILQSTQRKMLGEGLASCSMRELNELERQVERGLSCIRATKTKILLDQIEQLKRKLSDLQLKNGYTSTPSVGLGSKQHMEVETQLVIRPPDVQGHL